MTGYERGNAKQRGAAALSAPSPSSASDEFRDVNFECAMRPFTPVRSSGSQSSEFERISQPSISSELEARESAPGYSTEENFYRRRVDGNFERDEAPSNGSSSPDAARVLKYATPFSTPAQCLRPRRNASTQTDVPQRVDSDQNFADLIPRYATELLGLGQRHYGPVGIFIALLFFVWRYLMTQGSHYYVRMEIGGYGMDPS